MNYLDELQTALNTWDRDRFNYQPEWQRTIVEAARKWLEFASAAPCGHALALRWVGTPVTTSETALLEPDGLEENK